MNARAIRFLSFLFLTFHAPAHLLAAPANDSFLTPTVVSGLPAAATGTNVDATLQVGEPLPAAGGPDETSFATASVWFEWTPTVTGSVRIDTLGSGFDTILAVWTGSYVTALSELASNNQFYGFRGAVFIDAVAGTTYRIAVYGYSNQQGPISLNIQSDASSRITGSVTRLDGVTPLAETQVTAYSWSSLYSSWLPMLATFTQADGSYSARGLEPGTYRIGFGSAHYFGSAYSVSDYLPSYYNGAATVDSATDIPVPAAATIPNINASLTPETRISGIVTGPDGITPLAGIQVDYFQWVGTAPVGSWQLRSYATSQTNGSYAIRNIPPGTYRVAFRDPSGSHVLEYYDNAAALDSARDIVVPAFTIVPGINASLALASGISGRVTAPDGITPLANIRVTTYTRSGSNPTWQASPAATTQADGSYSISGLRPGTYRVGFGPTYENNDYLPEFYNGAVDVSLATDISLLAGSTVPNIDASLALASGVSGIVTGPDGITPLAGILVNLYRPSGTAPNLSWQPMAATLSLADGTYRIGGLQPETYRMGFQDPAGSHVPEFYNNAVDVSSAANLVLPPATTVPGISASLAAASRISGRVTGPDGTTPLANIPVTVYSWDSPALAWRAINTTFTQADGRYSLGGLTPGTYRVGFGTFFDNTGYAPEYFDGAGDVDTATDIVLPAATTVPDIDASLLTASRISGTVTGPDGVTPLSGIQVTAYRLSGTAPYLFSQRAGATMTLANGTYNVGGFQAGTYRVEFRDLSGNHVPENYPVDIAVPASTTVSGIDASLALASTISGIVTGPDGVTPLANLQVTAYSWDSASASWQSLVFTATRADGGYTVGGLVPGPYRIKFGTSFYRDYQPEYYNDSPSLDAAQDIPVPASTNLTGINASLAIYTPPVPVDPKISSFRQTGPGLFEIAFIGTPGQQYQLQQSASLTTWDDFGSPFTYGGEVLVGTLSSSAPTMFWRVKSVP